jgi:hypothetical protein
VELIQYLFAELPVGEPPFRLGADQKQDASSASYYMQQRWYEVVAVQTALACIESLMVCSARARVAIASDRDRVLVLLRCLTGLSWCKTPVFTRDPSFAGNRLYQGIPHLMASPTERDLAHQLRNDASKTAATILFHLSSDHGCHELLSDMKFSSYQIKMPRPVCGNEGSGDDGVGDSDEQVFCSDFEAQLLGIVTNSRVPNDILCMAAATLSLFK